MKELSSSTKHTIVPVADRLLIAVATAIVLLLLNGFILFSIGNQKIVNWKMVEGTDDDGNRDLHK